MKAIRRYEITDAGWELIEDLFPVRRGGRGRPARDPRQMLNGVFWVLWSGAPWRDVPPRYGPWETVYCWFRRWQRDQTLDRVLERLQFKLDESGYLDWDVWCIDGSSVRASKAAAGAGKRGATPSRWIML